MLSSIRITLGNALLWTLIGFSPAVVEAAEALRPPKPSGFNEALPYALATTAEGTLKIRFSVLETGEVESWEILEVPTGIDNVHELTRETVEYWEFEPAQNAHGKPVPGTYDYVWMFSPYYRYELARVYPKGSAEVKQVFDALAKELKLKFPRKDEANGVYVSKWIRFDKSRFSGLEAPEGIRPFRVRFFIHIPQGIEPARVYFNSELEAETRPARLSMLFYNAGGFESWLFDRLEEKLETQGRLVPRNFEARRELFRQLAPGSSDCSQKEPMMSGVGNVSNPVLIDLSKHDLIYPPSGVKAREDAQVIVQAIVNEDGSVGELFVIRSTTRNVDFSVSTKQTVSFWRYKPARYEGCPVAVYFTVVADFKVR